MKTIVIYYSRKGSNKFLAEKLALHLKCDIEAIRPRLNSFGLFLMNFNLGIKPLKHQLKEYDRILMVGPIWMGRFIPPLRSFLKKYQKDISKLVFVSCCGSTFEKKDEKFGHGLVFKEVESILKEKLIHCQAFPIGLVLPDEQKDDTDAFMKTHLNTDNFKGEIVGLFDDLLKEIS